MTPDNLLEELHEDIRKCSLCPLHETRMNAVPGEGPVSSRIMFIGEAPGAREDESGRPFVGRSGDLLTSMMEEIGLSRDAVFITSILKSRPPKNRTPTKTEIGICRPYLEKQIEIINPVVIVALGAHAARTLLNTNKSIGQMRGQFHQYYSGLGRAPIKLMPTYHTAYLLRNYSQENRQRVWEDMKKVLAELGLPIPER